MKGKLYTSKPNDLKKHLDYIRSDKVNVLLITQYGFDFKDAFRYTKLAPSKELFLQIDILKNKYKDNWFDYYSDLFNTELLSEEKQFGINEVISALESGLDIVLVCYCNDYNVCHRKLVAEYFQQKGIYSKELIDK